MVKKSLNTNFQSWDGFRWAIWVCMRWLQMSHLSIYENIIHTRRKYMKVWKYKNFQCAITNSVKTSPNLFKMFKKKPYICTIQSNIHPFLVPEQPQSTMSKPPKITQQIKFSGKFQSKIFISISTYQFFINWNNSINSIPKISPIAKNQNTYPKTNSDEKPDNSQYTTRCPKI